MKFGWNKVHCSPIGVDFGADSLKLLQVVPGDPPQLQAAAAAELPAHARSDPAARYAFYIEALKTLLKLQPFKGKQAILSIPAYQTLVQQVQINRSEGEEGVLEQVEMHLRQRLNLDPSRMVIRHYVVGQVMRDGAAKDEVVVVAAARDTVMKHVELARRVGLDVVGMHAEPQAILKAFHHLYRRASDQERTTAFIDIGAATTKIVIAHGGELAFAKMIHAAGDHFTKQRAQSANVEFAQARALRRGEAQAGAAGAREQEEAPMAAATRAVGTMAVLEAAMAAEQGSATTVPGERRINSDSRRPPASALGFQFDKGATATMERRQGPDTPGAGAGAGMPGSAGPRFGAGSAALSGPPATDTLGDAMECLRDELQLCLRYHQGLFPDRPLEKLVFLGGEAQQVAICQHLAKTLRIGAQLGDPLARVMQLGAKKAAGVDLNQPQPGWAVPLGLCLSEHDL